MIKIIFKKQLMQLSNDTYKTTTLNNNEKSHRKCQVKSCFFFLFSSNRLLHEICNKNTYLKNPAETLPKFIYQFVLK